MAFTYTDRNEKVVLASFGRFRAVVKENVVTGDLLTWYQTDAVSALELADQSSGKFASAVALEEILAGEEGACAVAATLKAPTTIATGGIVTQVYFSASADFYGVALFIGESGKAASAVGARSGQVVGHNINRFTIMLDPLGGVTGLAGEFTTLAASGNVSYGDPTDASSSTTGGVVITGGLGIAKKLFIGTDFDIAGTLTVDGTTTIVGLAPITDPGDAGAISVLRSGYVPLVTAAAETRTVADPSAVGMILMLSLKTDGGDCVITFASPIDQSPKTIATFNTVGESMMLMAVEDGSDIEWRVCYVDDVILS